MLSGLNFQKVILDKSGSRPHFQRLSSCPVPPVPELSVLFEGRPAALPPTLGNHDTPPVAALSTGARDQIKRALPTYRY